MLLYHTVTAAVEGVVEVEGAELSQRLGKSGRKERWATLVAVAVAAVALWDRPILFAEALAIEAAAGRACVANSCSQGCWWL